jgi:hypothetical protein
MIQQTGTTDIPLTSRGEEQVRSEAKILVGPGGQSEPSTLRQFAAKAKGLTRSVDSDN